VRGCLPPSPRWAGRKVGASTFGPSPGSQVDTFPRLLPRPRGSGGEAGLIPRPRVSGGEGRVRGCLPPSPRCAGRKVEASTFGPSPGSQVDTFPRLLPRPRGSGGEAGPIPRPRESGGEAGLIPRPRGSGGEGRVRGCLPPSPRCAGRKVEANTFGPSPGSQVDTFPRLLPRPRASGGEGRVRGCLPPSPRCAGRGKRGPLPVGVWSVSRSPRTDHRVDGGAGIDRTAPPA